MSLTTGAFFWAACAAVAIPILIHLLMRGKPRRVVFPAVRFVRERLRSNRKRFRLKQALLLLLRAAALILFGLLLARPIRHGAAPKEDAGLPGRGAHAVALVFDTSLRMGYEQSGRMRLDEAKEFGLAVLERLPADARTAVFDTQNAAGAFQVDTLAAREAIGRLEPAPQRTSLPDALAEAVRLLAAEPGEKEIFILSDGSAAGWPAPATERLTRLPDELGGEIRFYHADFSPGKTQNVSLSGPRIAVTRNDGKGEAEIGVTLTAAGEKGNGSLELTAEAILPAGGDRIRLTETFAEDDFAEDGTLNVTFPLRRLEDGVYQGTITKSPPDPLAADDRVFFTFEIRPPKKILFAAPEPAETHALFMQSAAALSRNAPGRAPFEAETLSYEALSDTPLDPNETAAVFLLDPPPLSAEVFGRIEAFVRAGGGAGFFLGRATQPGQSEYAALLGGVPLRQVNVPEGTALMPGTETYEVLSGFGTADRARSAPWARTLVYRYWRLDWNENTPPPAALGFADGQPALVERPLGRGRVVVSTTPFSDLPSDPKAWNRITTGEAAWLFLALTDGITRTLTGNADSPNKFPFETASISADGIKEAELVLPDGGELSLNPPEDGGRLTLSGTGQIGSYRILDGGKKATLGGFSVNPRPEETDLTPLAFDRLQEMFGKTPLVRIDSADRLEAVRSRLESHTDLYSLLALLLALVLAGELWCAGRLYE